MPHGDTAIIREAKRLNMICTPGIATPTEGYAALAAGADGLKLFPAEMLTPKVVKALRAVFTKDTVMIPVGGITPEVMADFWRAGANGFGLGSALYRPGVSIANGARRRGAIRDISTAFSALISTNSISKSKRTRRRAADSAIARQGEADKVIFDLEME